MRDGVLQQVDRPQDAYQRPRNVFVAKFIGERETNFLEGELVEKQGRFSLVGEKFEYPLTGRLTAVASIASSQRVLLGVRAEDVKIYREAHPGSVQSEVILLEPMGSHAFVHLRVGSHIVVAKVAPDFRLEPGDRVWVTFDANKAHLFDASTQEVILPSR